MWFSSPLVSDTRLQRHSSCSLITKHQCMLFCFLLLVLVLFLLSDCFLLGYSFHWCSRKQLPHSQF